MENISMYLKNHPVLFMSVWVKYDYLNLSNHDFMVKYFRHIVSIQNEVRRENLRVVLQEVWRLMNYEDRNCVILAVLKGHDKTTGFHLMLDLHDQLELLYLNDMINEVYFGATGRIW